MKKTSAIIVVVLILAGMAALLLTNKRKSQSRAASALVFDKSETVSTEILEKEFFRRDFSANGVSKAAKDLNFVSDVSGRVVAVYADKGSRVAKGTPLLKIDTELYEADYKAAKAAYEALKKDEQRFTRSNEAGGVTAQQLDNIRTQLIAAESRLTASRWKYENAVVKSPMAGSVNARFVEVGALIAPNAPLFEIVDDSSLEVVCNVAENKLGLVSVGQRVSAGDSSLPGVEFWGTVKHVGIKTDRGLNYPVEIALDKDSRLRVGMYLKIRFSDAQGREGLLIPRKAVVGSAMAASAFVVEDGKAVRRELVLGDMQGDRVEVLEGLKEGDEIIVSGLMNVGDGSEVKVVNK